MSKTSQLKLNYSKSINLLKVFNNDKNPKKINLFSNYLFDKKIIHLYSIVLLMLKSIVHLEVILMNIYHTLEIKNF